MPCPERPRALFVYSLIPYMELVSVSLDEVEEAIANLST